MGTMVELNDTLQLTTDQGFPAEVFDYAKHQRSPIVLDDVKGRLFSFHGKPSARIYQLDPVRVYLVHNIENKWLFWGRALIQSLEIEKQLQKDGRFMIRITSVRSRSWKPLRIETTLSEPRWVS
jgi:hypothetical protein